MDNENQLLAAIRNGDERSLDELYSVNKSKFFAYARGYLKDEAVLEDIYQDTIIAFYENVRTGKVRELKSSISTYIIGIGKFMMFGYLRKEKSAIRINDMESGELERVFHFYLETVQDENEALAVVRQAIQRIGEPCRTLLQLFYYEEKDNAAIMEMLGYANTNVVKSQKYRCLQTLKAIVEKISIHADKL